MSASDNAVPTALRQARVAFQKGNATEALSLLQVYLATSPNDVGALNLAGLAQLSIGRVEAAASALEKALTLDPDHVESLTHLGIAKLNLGDIDAGVQSLEQAVARRFDYLPAQFNLGLAYLRAGRTEEAIDALRRVTKVAPKNAGGWLNLGVAYLRRGENKPALDAFRKAHRLAPKDPVAKRNLANLLVETGAALEGARLFEQLAGEGPPNPLVMVGLATAYERLGRRLDAIALYEEALTADPDLAAAHANIAPQLERFGRFDEAEEHLRHATTLSPDRPEPFHNLISLLIRTGRHDDAATLCGEGASRWPDDPYFLERLAGHLYRRVGDVEGGRRTALSLLDRFPDNITAVELLMADDGYQFSADLAGDLAARVETAEDSAEDQGRIAFVLFNYWHRSGNRDEATKWLLGGNAAIASTYEHKPNDDTVLTARIIKTFDDRFFESRRGYCEGASRPIFIVGMPRSGTTLVEQVLSQHSKVRALGELRDVGEIAEDLAARSGNDRGFPRALAETSQEQFAAAAERYTKYTTALAGDAPVTSDKMPGNFRYLGLIAVLFPNARILHCRRDPRDVCFSIYRHNFHGEAHAFGFDQKSLAHYYRQYERLMAHWTDVLPIPIHDVVYENLVADFEPSVRAMLDYCGLDFEESCLRYYESARGADTASWSQVRQPLFRSSIGAWRQYEAALGPLIKGLADR